MDGVYGHPIVGRVTGDIDPRREGTLEWVTRLSRLIDGVRMRSKTGGAFLNRPDLTKMMGSRRRYLLEALAAFALFCLLTGLSRRAPEALHAAALSGLVFPLVWAKATKAWAEMGFTADGLIPAIAWGIGTGVIAWLTGYVTVAERSLAADEGIQLAVGVPV